MKNYLLTICLISFASSAYAISDGDLTQACLETGKIKIAKQAHVWNCKVDMDSIRVSGIDNRWFNPSKYVWYEVPVNCNGQSRISQLVQFYDNRCF